MCKYGRRALAAVFVLGAPGCPQTPPPPPPLSQRQPPVSSVADAGQHLLQEPPGLLLRAAELAYAQNDRDTARRLLDVALAKIAPQQDHPTPLTVALAQGLADPDYAGQPVATAAITATGERAAVGHGRLLSVIDLDGTHRIHRLAPPPARLRRVVPDGSGRHIATLADDGMVRLSSIDGEPGFAWPLLSPRDKADPARPAVEAAYRATWIDFSPDARLLFLADCGTTPAAACPLRRLRVYAVDRGQLLHTLTAGAQELLDYTARSDGTVAVLFAGGPPHLYAAPTGAELPLTSSVTSASSQKCLEHALSPLAREHAFVVSPNRRWLANLADPATLCLWDLSARQLVAASAIAATAKAPVRLMSLLGDNAAHTLVVSTAAQRGELWDPTTGRRTSPPSTALGRLTAVMPLDDGGALISGLQSPQSSRHVLQLSRLSASRRLMPIAAPELASLTCLAAFPDAVRGDGGMAIFAAATAARSVCPPALVELSAAQARVHRLVPPGRAALAAADFIDDQRLVVVDEAARLQTFLGTQVEYAAATSFATVTQISPPAHSEELLIQTADQNTYALWPSAGKLRLLPPSPSSPSVPTGPPDPPQRSATYGPLRAEVDPTQPPQLRVRDTSQAGQPLRFTVPVAGLPSIHALAFMPDGKTLAIGGPGGTVVWLDSQKGSERLRLQLVPGGAVVLYPDAHFEILGTVDRPQDYLVCRAGTYPIPLSLCNERQNSPNRLPTLIQ